jgi:hypothetical protein
MRPSPGVRRADDGVRVEEAAGGVDPVQVPALPGAHHVLQPEALPGAALPDARRVRGLDQREVSGWPKRCKLAHVLLWLKGLRGPNKRLTLAQLLGQLGACLTFAASDRIRVTVLASTTYSQSRSSTRPRG